MQPLGDGDPLEVGPYRIAGVLGAGGMGRVYLGHSRSGRAVAVKVVNSELAQNPDFRHRFAREIAAARAVSGVFTAALVDADPEAERPWLATAYVEAPTLTQSVAATGPLPESSLRFLTASLAEALDAIHRAGVVHRDLKPSNVLLAPDGPRVIDFGIARALEGTSITRADSLLGSPGFMAPEQLTRGEVGPPCDVFCLGLVICFAAGVMPYGEGPAQALLYRIVHESPDLSALPEGPRGIVAACLAKDPAARPTPSQILDWIGASDALAPAPTVKVPRNHAPRVEAPPTQSAQMTPPVPMAQVAPLQGPTPLPEPAATAAWQSPDTVSATPYGQPQQQYGQPQGQGQPHSGLYFPQSSNFSQSSAFPQQQNPYASAYAPTAPDAPNPGIRGGKLVALIGIPVAVVAIAITIFLVATANGGSSTGGSTSGGTAGAIGGIAGGTTGGPTTTPTSAPTTPPASAGPNSVNAGTAKDGGTVTYAMTAESPNPNPLDYSSVPDGVGYTSALLPAPFIPQPDSSIATNNDLVTSADQTAASPQTLVYKINPKAVWNDGTAITADDFKYAWLTQAGSDPDIGALSSAGYADIASIAGADNGKTVTVTLKPGVYFSDWKSLFPLLPAHLAAQHGYSVSLTSPPASDKGLEDSWTWFGANLPTWSGGPFQVDSANSVKDGSKITLVRNPQWYGAKAPHLDKVVFQYLSDRNQAVAALQGRGTQVFVDSDVTDAAMLQQVKALDPTQFSYQLSPSMAWDHLDLNMQSAALGGAAQADQQNPAKLALRQAILTAVDRKALVSATVGRLDGSAQPLNSRMFMPGQAGYTDDVGKFGLGSGDLAKAAQILTAAGYTGVGSKLVAPGGTAVPPLTMRYTNGNQRRQQEDEIVRANLAKLGVTVSLQTTTSLSDSLNHTAGKDYDLITYGWTGSPYSLSSNASTWLTKTAANQGASNNYAGFTDSKVDAKLTQAATETDPAKAAADENDADAQISQDAASLPLFQWESVVVHAKPIVGLRDNTTGSSPAYNMQEWGFSAS